MRHKSIIRLITLSVLSLMTIHRSEACTNIVVSKGASADGSCIVSYAADSHWLYGELYFHPEQDWKDGSMLNVYEWDSGRYLGKIPQVKHTYKTLGNMNEHQLIIAETTFGGREELSDKYGIMDYGSLIYITLQRAKTAREAIQTIVELANKYGYYSEGESFSIVDKNEAWVMDLIGKGTCMSHGENINKGIVWVARKIPDGFICAHANQSRISTFPLNDPKNCLYAPDVISFAREQGYFEGEDEDFSFCDAYCPNDFGTTRGCDARVWSAFNLLCNGWFTFYDEDGNMVTKDAYNYVNYAMGYDLKNPMPLFVRPNKKISVKNVADAMRDHYEGTPMDMTTDIGAGGNALPYRWRPMYFEYEGKQYVNERAIATQQTGFWFVAQARNYLPDVIGGLMWFGVDDAATSWLTPIYANTNKIPDCFKVGNGDLLHYSSTSAFWICNRVANSCYRMYNIMEPFVRKHIDAFENEQMENAVKANDREALALYNNAAFKIQKKMAKAKDGSRIIMFSNDPLRRVKRMLTKYSVNTAQKMFKDWVELEETMMVKFIDGNVKAQNPDGSFKHTDFSTGVPKDLKQPGFTEKWKEAVVRDNGKTLEVKESK